MGELSTNAEVVRRRLGGLPYVGPEPDLSLLTDAELGELAALVWEPRQDVSDPWVIRLRATLAARCPRFDGASAVAALQTLTANVSASLDAVFLDWIPAAGAQVIAGCSDPKAPEVQTALSALLERRMPAAPDPLVLALQSCAGQRLPEHPDALVSRERRFLETLERPADRIALGRLCKTWAFAVDDAELTPRGADPLALLPGYLAFAERLVSDALDRVHAIHRGSLGYVPDGAFSVEEAQTLRRALLAGLDQEADWAKRDVVLLLQGVSLAPNPAHHTVPSQSVSIALLKAIAERPSPALVAELRTSVRALRHAGLKKKADRFLKMAERRLVARVEFLSELDPALELPKGFFRMVAQGFEALLLRTAPLPEATWFARILENAETSKCAAALVWRLGDGRSALPALVDGRWSFIDARGELCALAGGAVRLWHPLQAHADADAWRSLVVARRLRQPFNQVFRETYSAASLPLLTAPLLDVRSLLGLARARGWLLRHGGCLLRRIGAYRVELDVGGVFPGAIGSTRCYGISFFRGGESESVDPSVADPQALSECLREIDLLVSVAASVLDPALADDTAGVRSRRAVLVRMLGETPAAERPFVDGRYVRSGELAIHIATGRVSKNGEECDSPLGAAKGRVLPYPDKILGLVVAALDRQRRGVLGV